VNENVHAHQCADADHRGREDFGCKCVCGAVQHFGGWQQIRVTPPKENPCVVIMDDGEFDVDEYRADLLRRKETLESMADQYYQKFSTGKRENDHADWRRCVEKSKGLEIALSLLPKESR
jgi:hypothetical protein